MTLKGQGRDPICLELNISITSGDTESVTINGAAIGNSTRGIKWSRARWRHVTLLPVSGYWGPGGGCALQALFLPNMVSLETMKIQRTISVTRKQFYDTCLQKYCFRIIIFLN